MSSTESSLRFNSKSRNNDTICPYQFVKLTGALYSTVQKR